LAIGITKTVKRGLEWTAGLFEGEGSAFINKQCLRVSVSSTDRDVLDAFCKIVGFGKVYDGAIRLSDRGNQRKPEYYFSGSGAHAATYLYRVMPLLGKRRRKRVNSVLKEWLAL
jgi:hypothetical protein